MNNMKNKSSKKSLIKFIILDTFLLFCVITLLYQFYQSKKFEERMEQVMTQSRIEREERQKQEQLERQKEQEELARQEQERLEKMKESLPTKFNMRDKIKITAENQGQKPFCSIYAQFKSMEITLNYQGNYNYDFKKVYNYLKTASDSLRDEIGTGKLYDMSKELLGFDFTYATYSPNPEDLYLIKNEIVNGRPMLIDINAKMSVAIGGDPKYLGTERGNGHEMIIIGYDDTKQSWLCLNSWGANWGKNGNGTIWIRYDNENIEYPYNSMFQVVIKE